MKKTKAVKIALHQKLKKLQAENKKHKKEALELGQKKARIEKLIDESQHYSVNVNHHYKKEDVPFIQGIYIVSKHNGTELTMTHYKEFVRGKPVPHTFVIKDILKNGSYIQNIDDNEKTDLNIGALLMVKIIEKNVFHLVNAVPSDAEGRAEYAIALRMLNVDKEFVNKFLSPIQFAINDGSRRIM